MTDRHRAKRGTRTGGRGALHNTTHNFYHLKCQSDDRKRPSITFHDLPWHSLNFYDLPWASMTLHQLLRHIIKTGSNVRTSLIWAKINFHLTPRLVHNCLACLNNCYQRLRKPQAKDILHLELYHDLNPDHQHHLLQDDRHRSHGVLQVSPRHLI